MQRQRLQTLIEIAVMAAVAGVLSALTPLKAWWFYGGSISLAMVPIVVISFRRGWKAGVFCGFLVGLINYLLEPFIVHPVQVVLDYPVAYAALGVAGAVSLRDTGKAGEAGVNILRISAAVALAGLFRLAAHFISGVIWFAAYAPEGLSPVLYSFLYNASYILPDTFVSIAVMAVLIAKAPHLVRASR
ncbi:energy-coupled thiamine transporter ThiT [Paludifilum halophilum]|nr:energy-coupled thiamine transporter ThiT [Paludifilum halophilum]